MINNKEFIKLEYTGRLIENKKVFDTTDKKLAEQNKIFNPEMKYEPVVVCLGQNLLVPGLEKNILHHGEVGKEQTVTIKAEDAFGKKDPKNLRLIPLSAFKDKNVTPYPGLQVQIGNSLATIKTVTGGRCIVDFNNPLSGHDVEYHYKILEIVSDKKQKVSSIFKLIYGININVEETDNKLSVGLPDALPKNVIDEIKKKVKELSDVDLSIELIKTNNDTHTEKQKK